MAGRHLLPSQEAAQQALTERYQRRGPSVDATDPRQPPVPFFYRTGSRRELAGANP